MVMEVANMSNTVNGWMGKELRELCLLMAAGIFRTVILTKFS